MGSDKDDVLGNQGFMNVDTANVDTKWYSMHMEKTSTWGWSTWNYDLSYEIKVEPTTNAPTF